MKYAGMPTLPSVEGATEYYKKSMTTGMMQWLCRKSGKKKYPKAAMRRDFQLVEYVRL